MHLYKINFQYSTIVKLLEDDIDIPTYGFNFIPFSDITSQTHDDGCLVDVIGHLTGKSDVQELNRDGKGSKLINIELTDLELGPNDGSYSLNLSQISNTSSVTIEEDLLNITVPKKIVDLSRSSNDSTSCVILATVLGIGTNKGWYYNSCKKCTKKVIPDGSSFICEKCQNIVSSVIPKFKLELKVVDDTGSVVLILFDREVYQFLGSSAIELLQGLVVDFGDTSSVPDRLDEFLGKKFLFKLKIKDDRFSYFDPKYIVMRMSDRESLIEQYNRNKDDIQQSPCSNTTPVLSEFHKESGTIDLEASSDHCITPVKRTSTAYYDDSSPSIIEIPSETSSNKYRKIIKEEDQ
ncbi:replication protein A 70 kDa DNA-binding subunit B-like [Senna tora]|uniref:Replication protein A 70 kDa DNA-binding subunit B-like n=1 Tax=Senna tora TaxID=362788 RepID=A0A834T2W2_9FABA|nr:replication protein A 70 kDa DNA-binding subunit B-like [Senna tora]